MYKKTTLILYIILLSFVKTGSISALASDSKTIQNIAIIDIKKVLSDSLAAKSILKDLNNKMSEYQLDINNKSSELQKKQDLLKEQATVLTESVINEKQKEIFEQLQILEKDVAEKKEKLQSAYVSTLQQIEKKILEIVENLSKKNGYNLVLAKENLLYYQDVIDISQMVISALNTQLPKIELSLM